jgi:peptidoglycan/LPS O-acetylase OafA/YrhL
MATEEHSEPSPLAPADRPRNFALDLVRGLAALEVMFSHIRNFIFEDFPKLPYDTGLLTNAFYYFTGFGRQAVFIFFVLSGYLVGGSILGARPEGFAGRYAVQRLTRLWIVLLPCLAATLLWNGLGDHTGGADYLNGRLNPPVASAPSVPIRTDLLTILGNIFFLQSRYIEVLGDNGPLWSLAYEFCYYAAFPLLVFALRTPSSIPLALRGVFLGVVVVILALPPEGIVMGFGVWLAGVAAYAWVNSRFARHTDQTWFGVLSIAACLGLFHLSRHGEVSDFFLGLGFAATLPYLVRKLAAPRWLASTSAWLADFSYTLYLAHFPFVAFLWYTLLGSERLLPSATATGRFVVLSLAAVGYSYLLSLLFERHTNRLRRWVMRRIQGHDKRTPNL